MKRWLLACLSMLCMVALLVGCGNDTAKDGKQGKHMNVGLYWFGETLDPTHEWDAWTLTRIGAGETLATVTPDMKFTPQLADSWENVDPTTWKFHIRENVKFHNGTPMTPQKVKESIEYTMKQSARSAKAVKIESITVDGQNLIIKTTEPNGSLLSSLTEPAFVIMDTADLKDVASKPVLTGPYKITAFKKGETIELAAFADYWGGKPGLDTVTVKEFAQSWFDAEGTEKQAELTKQLVSVAEQNIALIDEVIDYARSERAIQSLGEEGAANLLQHAKDIKAEGAEFCDCAACVAAKNIIDLKAEIA